MRAAALMICAGILSAAFCQDFAQPKAMAAPTLPFYDWGACPYEACVYGKWTAYRPVTVYDTWKHGRRPIAELAAGDRVTGIRGAVVTLEPGTIRMDRDLPEQGLQRGDTILTYAFRGEGFSAVWFKGKYHPEFDISFAKWPDGTGCGGAHCAATYTDLGKKSWWAEVKLSSGQTGWVEMDLARMPISLFSPRFSSSFVAKRVQVSARRRTWRVIGRLIGRRSRKSMRNAGS